MSVYLYPPIFVCKDKMWKTSINRCIKMERIIFSGARKSLVFLMTIQNVHCLYYILNMIEAHRKTKISSPDKIDEDLLTFLCYMNNEVITSLNIFLWFITTNFCKTLTKMALWTIKPFTTFYGFRCRKR